MTLIATIEADLTTAIKNHYEIEINTLRMLKANLHNWQIANKKDPQDQDIIALIQKEIKSRRESISIYRQAKRQELAQKEEGEIGVLKKYLPEQMSRDDIVIKVKEAIAKTNAKSPQDIGKVMGILMGELKGKADGAQISQIVKENLSK
ncbi:MAG: GatB/YqeY domain-containing protein [Patescibacteria group bacterium]